MSLFTEMYMRKNNSLSPERDKRNRFLNELHVNGEDVTDDDDFNIEDEENEDEGTNNNPSDQAQDAADNPESGEQDAAPMTDPDENIEDEDNFTLQDDDIEDPQETEGEQPTETTEEVETSDDSINDTPVTDEANVDANDDEDDFTIQDDDGTSEDAQTDEGGEEAPADNNTNGNDQEDDFTMSDDEGDGGAPIESDGSDQGQEGGEGDNQQTSSNDQAPADPSDNISDEDIKTSEEQMYDSLTDDQKRIRTLSLKMEFKDLYESILGVIDGINGIPKSLDNIDSIKRVTNYVTKAKNILIDYIQNNFDTNPYLENYTIYIKFMAIFRTVGNVINDLNAQAGKSTDINTDVK